MVLCWWSTRILRCDGIRDGNLCGENDKRRNAFIDIL